MNFIDIFIIAIGLSMDAFAVAICKGLNMKKLNYKHGFVIATFFGLFQAFMPVIGWFLGTRFQHYIVSVDHWIAFILLSLIGINMLRETFSNEDGKDGCGCVNMPGVTCQSIDKDKLNLKELLILAIATSIDALAVGITLALNDVNIINASTTIGVTTLILSMLGVIIGNRFGSKYEKKATLAGGILLILMGIKILISHLG